jgi:sterol-4alpha-carboxylate 3-dehydrogenase (decarboxylating)
MSEGPKPVKSLGKVIVVGGCGFLGGHIVSLIVKRHPESQVSVLDLRTNLNRNASPKVAYHDCDITNPDQLKSLFSTIKPDVVINTASPHFNAPPAVHDKVNVGGTKNLVKAAQDSGVKAFVHTSSASVILGPGIELVNADERWPMITGAAQPEYYTTTKVGSLDVTTYDR